MKTKRFLIFCAACALLSAGCGIDTMMRDVLTEAMRETKFDSMQGQTGLTIEDPGMRFKGQVIFGQTAYWDGIISIENIHGQAMLAAQASDKAEE